MKLKFASSSLLVGSSYLVQASLVLGDMLERKVDTDFSSLYPEISSKNQYDLSMEVTRRVVTWHRG